jgi:glutathione S-transferase
MKLVFTPNPGYIHKALVVAHEAGVLGRLQLVRSVPFDDDTTIWDWNPLGKVPCLILDDGLPLLGGMVICEYLDSLAPAGRALFPAGAERWPALRLAGLGEGLFDATTLIRVEGWRPPQERHVDAMLRERRKVVNALDAMEREVPRFATEPFHIGHVCMAGGLSYLELRNPVREHALLDGDADFDWRRRCPRLAGWFHSIQSRASIVHRVTREQVEAAP